LTRTSERTTAYEAVNKKIMEEYLPGLAISHSAACPRGQQQGVKGLVVSPLTAEKFDLRSRSDRELTSF
jgi:peptide/nickel transport system substrate-binding protein